MRNRLLGPALGIVFGVAGVFASAVGFPGGAQAQELSQLSCRALWYQRNLIYSEAGYCFQTADAIATFGRGCFPPYGKLTGAQQRRVNEIRAWEARRGCN